MLIAKIEQNKIIVGDYRELFPNTSFSPSGPSTAWMMDHNCLPVSVFIPHDRATEKLVTASPYVKEGQVFTVRVEAKTAAELLQEADSAKEKLLKQIIEATQQRLDTFAQTRNYDSILSACTYATSLNPKFSAEGQYCVQVRDNMWSTLYGFIADVEAGIQPMPSSFEDIEPLLPVLEWPL